MQYLTSVYPFLSRVEDDMRPLVRTAMATSSATVRKAKKDVAPASRVADPTTKPDTVDDEPTSSSKPSRHTGLDTPKEFKRTSSSAPRRLNDIAQAPPELPKLKKAAGMTKGKDGGKEGVLSMAQRAMMEAEREKAIQRYRELKETRLHAKELVSGQS